MQQWKTKITQRGIRMTTIMEGTIKQIMVKIFGGKDNMGKHHLDGEEEENENKDNENE